MSSLFAERLASGQEPETMRAVRTMRKDQSTRKDLGKRFPADFRKARSIIDVGLSDMRQTSPTE